MPQIGSGGAYSPNKISLSQAITLARNAGFSGTSLVNIVSIALAESGLDANAQNCNNPGGSCDRGIIQINNYWHSEVTDQCAYDPQCAFKSAYTISQQGSSFQPWTTFTSGAYKQFVNTVQQAINGNSNNTPITSTTPASGGICDVWVIGGIICSQFFEQGTIVLVGLLVALVAIVMIALGSMEKEG